MLWRIIKRLLRMEMTKSELTENGLYWYRESRDSEWTVVGVQLAVEPCGRETSSVDWMASDIQSYFHELPDTAEFRGPLEEPE